MIKLTYLLAFLYLFVAAEGYGKSCASILSATSHNLSDNFNTYAIGPLVDGRRRIHVVEHASFIINPKKWVKRAKEIVLERENFNFPHKPMDRLEEKFDIIVPKVPAPTKTEFEGPDGKKRIGMLLRTYKRSLEDNLGYSEIKDFVYSREGAAKMLFMVEVMEGESIVELIFTIRTSFQEANDYAAQYGFYLMNKMEIKGRVIGVRLYGAGFD